MTRGSWLGRLDQALDVPAVQLAVVVAGVVVAGLSAWAWWRLLG